MCDGNGWKRQKFIPRVGSPPDVLSYYNLDECLDFNKYGSATKDIEALIALRKSYVMSIHGTTTISDGKTLNVEDNPRKDLTAENASLPAIINLDDDDVPTEEFRVPAMHPVIIDLEDDDLSCNKILSPLLEINEKKAVDEILTKNGDLNVQDQWLRKENLCSAGETETKKTQGVDLGIEAKDVMEDINGHSDFNCESSTKNIEVDTDLCINVVLEMDKRLEEDNGQTLPNSKGLDSISEINEDESKNPCLEVEDKMEEDNWMINTNCGSLLKVAEVNMDKFVEVDTRMGTTVNCEDPAKISECNKEKGVKVGFKDDEEVEVGKGNLDSHSGSLLEISQIIKDKGVHVGVQDDEIEEDNQKLEAGGDDIAHIWNEMTIALEYPKDTVTDCSNEACAVKNAEGCDHSFILKEDIGYVCRICGLIQRAIETIIEFQYAKRKRSRTYPHEASSGKHLKQIKTLPGDVQFSSHDDSFQELSIHPRHRKVMKPHQVEGFNFLLSNLVSDNPGGCIMAHAPGSGKTFMIISFLQSFMARYPAARPLIVLPRGIVSTWKKEFKRWQVEDIPLYDFYSLKADGRSQQLEVLQHWMSERSILFLSYKQFSSIVFHSDSGKIASECEEILLICPSILILDEGHTPRNRDTDILKSLEKVQTPRKVVLSGTLYQNHVEEVFNILNLVRPRILKLDASKMIKRRILSKVLISGRKSSQIKFSNNAFYEEVEYALLKDESFDRKVTVIQDLREMTSKVLHYYKGDSLDELQGLVDFTVFLQLSPRQQVEVAELKKMKNRFKRNSDGSSIYVHPLLKTLSLNFGLKEGGVDQKTDLFLEKLDEKEGVKAKFYLNLLRLCESSGEKLLVFSQYLLPLKFLERLTVKVMNYSIGKEIFMITGDSDSNLRDSYMEQFNNSSAARVFFGSIKACGEGISLVGASRVIILDVHLNPSVTRQAIGRAFRPGQVRKVYSYRLVASDSPEIDDHLTCFRKETISKLWFEWNGCLGERDFEMETVNVKDTGDLFLETPWLSEDVISIFKR